MKNIIRVGAVAAVSALALAACSSAPEETESSADSTMDAMPAETVDFKACMVSDAGGFDDKSFNQTGYEGLLAAEADLGIEINTAQSADGNEYGPNLDALVADGCDHIVSAGFLLGDATAAAAEANPDTHFSIIDFAYDPAIDNVKGLTFAAEQPSFLAGYVAASATQTGKVGTYGGMNIPSVTAFMDGYLAGVNYFNEETGGSVEVIGWDGSTGSFTESFDDIPAGKSLTQGMIDQGVDIILPVAGPVGEGSLQAASEAGDTWVIGVDSDFAAKYEEYADIILTSVLKKIDVAVEEAIAEDVDGAFSNENYLGTLENEGVGLADVADAVDASVVEELETIKAGIIDGSISVAVS
ncbi:BMP family lipoprotein [Demequina mangrovi]|uniref:Nucleoside-binding protein n=1 Tax=Demequina mangrovi TaxID=1043493 RepID=A0A1H6XX83_9MICO|nr:BMP family ABC transporter substrate-binding protein [Demequina mangrovi]SEJ33641.1 nucleoside-binding protein [Demequina mangrovi]